MNTAVTIRRVQPSEYSAVGALVRAAYESDYELDPKYLAEIEDVAGRDAGAQVLVAVSDDGVVLASVTVPHAGERLHDETLADEMDLRLLGVAHAARGRGIAEAVMHHCIDLARARGCQRVVLHTGEQMVRAQRLYERMSFERIPEREFTITVPGGTRRIFAYGLPIAARG